MPYNVTYMSGSYLQDMAFESRLHYGQWANGVRRIKSMIEGINNDGNAGAARVPHYRQWLAVVQAFVAQHTETFLPPDIKEAVNGVERGIGAPVTEWQNPPRTHLFVEE